MERENGYHRTEGEATYVPVEAEVEQPMQGGMRREQECLTGTTKPEEAEGWVRRMESIFAVMGAAEDRKVNLATFMFKNEASYWWDTTKHLLLTPGEKEVIFWNPFVKAFYEKYFPPIYRKEKEREFILLKQDRMSMVDYEVKFTALSRFAPKFVQNEEDKCTKFQDGLEAAIKSRVSVFEETYYNRLVNKAMIAERDVKELQERRKQYKRNRSEPS
ncbi:uncharacterized protein LOC132276099 [Cornus florida]|uniref:uncharacterized protein LOC132276099 n=1 Tax=Cornus florida TaxID=4283 RepID=UPI0028A0EF9E|nr:uncharacterized protein LOC132276099 [Cornus florida]